MYNDNVEIIKLPSGFKVYLSTDSYDNHYCNFTESQWFSFNCYINAGTYFPQIMKFITVLSTILNGRTSFRDNLLCNLFFGIGYTLLWFWGRCYKAPLLGYLSSLIGGNFFKFFLHYVVIAVIAFFVIKDWKVLLFCVIGGIISFIIKTIILSRFLTNTKYNDEIVKYISKFKYKQ